MLDDDAVERQYKLLSALGLPTAVPDVDPDALVAAMRHDKKVEHGRLRFILASRIGRVEAVEGVDPQAARGALAD